jgi:hypothetical protein
MAYSPAPALRDPTHQAYFLLRVGFVVLPILAGLDKLFDYTVEWSRYLAPWVNDLMPGSAEDFMTVVGVIEIAAGIVVLLSPRWGSLLVAAWLAGIILNLLTFDPPRYWDIALRDLGLLIAALTLNRLATALRMTTITQETRHLRAAA